MGAQGGQHLPDRIVRERYEELKKRKGFRSDRQVAIAVGVAADQPARWKKHETSPSGASLARLCQVFDTTPEYLFGRIVSDAETKRRLLDEVRRVYGRAEADVLARMGALTDHHKSILAGRIEGWADGLEDYEKAQLKGPAPETQFDRDMRQLREQGAIPAGEAKETPRSPESAGDDPPSSAPPR